MIRFLVLVLLALITFAVIYFIKNPGLFDEVWIYIVGLAGGVIQFFKMLWKKIRHVGDEVDKQMKKSPLKGETKTPPVIIANNEAVG